MTDHPTRADWWREVTDLDEVIPAGCPARAEWPNYAYEAHESIKAVDRPAHYLTHPLKGIRVFIDSRWTPPRPTPKVGDVIETSEDLEWLPVGAGVVDYREEIALKRCEQRWNYANLSSESCGSESVMGLAPITVIYLPKVGDDDD